MLAVSVDERQDDWDLHLPHVDFANNAVSAATGLEPTNQAHIGRLARSSITILDNIYAHGRKKAWLWTNFNTTTSLWTGNVGRTTSFKSNTRSTSTNSIAGTRHYRVYFTADLSLN